MGHWQNSIAPDETSQNEASASYLGLYYLPTEMLSDRRIKVKIMQYQELKQ